jgi:hypothetical protein
MLTRSEAKGIGFVNWGTTRRGRFRAAKATVAACGRPAGMAQEAQERVAWADHLWFDAAMDVIRFGIFWLVRNWGQQFPFWQQSPRLVLFFTVAGLSVAAISSVAAMPCGTAGASPSPELQRAIALYEEGWGGSDEALVEAMERLEERLASRERSPLVRAYYGSATLAHARLVPDRQKQRWLRRGAGDLDAAVKAAPGDVQVRLLRAVSYAVLPRIAGRSEMVRSDFEWLVAQAEAEGRLAPDCRQAIFYHAGAFALRDRDSQAIRWLERAAEIDSAKIIGQERVSRMLRLAREQLPLESGDAYDD